MSAVASSVTSPSSLSLYRQLWRAASQFHDYNFRAYAHRSIKEKYRQHQSERDAEKIRALVARGQNDLKVLQRQSLINQLYSSGDSIIEKTLIAKSSSSSSAPHASFTLTSTKPHQFAFQSWLNSAAISSKTAGVLSDKDNKYDEGKAQPSKSGPMPEN